MHNLYIWQEPLWQRWIGIRARLPNALLIKGPRGIGKLDFAMHVAASMLCTNQDAAGHACQTCPSCHWFELGIHPDFRLIQPDVLSDIEEGEEREATKKKPSHQIPVEQIRSLSDFANLSAHQGGYQIVLVHPAEAMNQSAANALLKTLEEPSDHMLLILLTHKPQQLLPTILSRCMTLAAPTPEREASSTWLREQGISEPDAALAQAGFAPLVALEIAQATVGEENGGSRLLLQAIRQPAKFDAYALAEQLQKAELANVVLWMQQWCYDLLSTKLTGHIRYNLQFIDNIKLISSDMTILNILRYQKELLVAQREALHTLNPKLFLESILHAYRHMALARM